MASTEAGQMQISSVHLCPTGPPHPALMLGELQLLLEQANQALGVWMVSPLFCQI